jgi:hypothetical protein
MTPIGIVPLNPVGVGVVVVGGAGAIAAETP